MRGLDLLARARVRQVPLAVAKVDRLTRSVAFLSRLRTGYDLNGILADGAGRDLVTGEDRSDMIRNSGHRHCGRKLSFVEGPLSPRPLAPGTSIEVAPGIVANGLQSRAPRQSL